ncbi:PLC-like phosphodiesterase [Auriculariales sp. MPI-PUGE-AT-0066]|nr:PLC-like phosphodiesterase [Auriculariales sp. MPI-PUGE-AT-0066]
MSSETEHEHNGDFIFGVHNSAIEISEEFITFLTEQGLDVDEVKRSELISHEPEDDSHPLASYFVSSSHNTYLLGKQLFAAASAKAYGSVLANNARCVEIDVWPSPDGPIVTHGHAYTDSLPFGEVCLEIGKGVKPDDWPVLVSLECHVPPEGQPELIQIIKNAWGDKVVDKALEDVDPSRASPRDFKGKILLMIEYYHTEQLPETSGEPADPASKITPELAAFGFYLRSMKPNGDDFLVNPIVDPALHLLVNISEPALRALGARSDELIAHSHTHFRRVYPEGLRIDSSNQDPVACWRNGSQIAALNWQNFDRGMQLNEALFSGTNGWALKPPSLRPLGSLNLKEHVHHVKQHFFTFSAHTFTVDIAGATGIPREGEGHDPEWSLYVTAELVHNNGNKEWHSNSKSVTFLPRANPMWHASNTWTLPKGDELAFIRLVVMREKWGYDTHLGFFAARISRLNVNGEWHMAKLLDAHGKDCHAALLVRFTFDK